MLDGWHARSWGPAVLDGWHAAQELGARGVWMGGTRLWTGAQELGARGVWMGGMRLRMMGLADGWVARGSGAGGMQMDGWRGFGAGSAEFGWVARSFGAGGPRSLVARGGARTLDGWPQELGAVARGPRFWMAGMQLWSWGARTVWMGGGPARARRVWMGGTRLRNGGELGARGVWMGGTRLWSSARGFDACGGHF